MGNWMRPLLFCTWQRCSSQKRTPACIVLRPALNRIVLGGLSYTITYWLAKTKGVKIRHASYSSVLIEIIHYAGGAATAGWVVFSPHVGTAYTVFIHNNIGNYHLPTILVSKSKVSSFYELCIENTAGSNEETRLNIKPSRQVADLTLTEYSSAADQSLYNVVTPSFIVQ